MGENAVWGAAHLCQVERQQNNNVSEAWSFIFPIERVNQSNNLHKNE